MKIFVDVEGGILSDVKAEFAHMVFVGELEGVVADKFMVDLDFDVSFFRAEHMPIIINYGCNF